MNSAQPSPNSFHPSRLAWPLAILSGALIVGGVFFAILNREGYASYIFTAVIVSCGVVGGLIASRRPENPIGWFFLTSAVSYGLLFFSREGIAFRVEASLPVGPWVAVFDVLVLLGALPVLCLMPLYFPNGLLISPRWQLAVRFDIALMVLTFVYRIVRPGGLSVLPSLVNPLGIEALRGYVPVLDTVQGLVSTAGIILAALPLIIRYRRSQGEERQQMKWLAYALMLWIVGITTTIIVGFFDISLANAIDSFLPLVMACIPAAVGVAVLRYRLYNIDILINRTLVYAILSIFVAGMYVLIVAWLGALFQTSGSLAISLVGTSVVALLFQPLRDRIQHGVNRLLYGDRDQPYTALARLGRRLDETPSPDDVLPTIVRTVRDALKLPYVAIHVPDSGGPSSAEAGELPKAGKTINFLLNYQGTTVGELTIAPRGPGETFSEADSSLLDDLVRQTAVAVHAVQLAAGLRASREKLVFAQAEERRRIRNDLHDDIGPRLASITLRVETARNRLSADPLAAELLAEIAGEARRIVADIRRVVHNLRPAPLDELGLTGALRSIMAAGHQPAAAHVTFDMPDQLPPLPAAVEVAIYRIAQEALTNIARHAHASRCHLALGVCDGKMVLRITDDGRGFDNQSAQGGLGLRSMRERASELGGTCTIGPGEGSGTAVEASFPIDL